MGKTIVQKDKKRAIVIGSGFGGLAMAIRLQARGFQTTILEKREKIGGRAYQFKEAGYTFDMGPSLITAPEIIADIFQAAGKKMSDYLSLTPLEPFYRVYFHDQTYIDYTGDSLKMKLQMRQFNAEDAKQYDAFMAAIKPIYDTVIADRLGGQPFHTLTSMLALLPKIIQLKAFIPVTQFVQKYFQDFRHHFLFSFHPLFIGGNPFQAPSIYLSIPYLEKEQGVWFTAGGMYAVVDALAKVFQELGGEICCNSEVYQLEVQSKQVVAVHTANQRYAVDLVVSNADVAHTYGKLIAEKHRKKWSNNKLVRIDHTMSCYLLYLGVKRQYPQLKHHTLILAKRYKELLADIFDHKVLADDFSMYLHAPTKSDVNMAPPGCESLYVLVPVPNLAAKIDWTKQTPVFTNKVIDFLEHWGLEGLRNAIEVQRVFTPLDFESQLNATLGNAFGIEPKLDQTAYFRPHNRSEDFANLYFVGAGTHPGAGVPGVMLSAEATQKLIVQDFCL